MLLKCFQTNTLIIDVWFFMSNYGRSKTDTSVAIVQTLRHIPLNNDCRV